MPSPFPETKPVILSSAVVPSLLGGKTWCFGPHILAMKLSIFVSNVVRHVLSVFSVVHKDDGNGIYPVAFGSVARLRRSVSSVIGGIPA